MGRPRGREDRAEFPRTRRREARGSCWLQDGGAEVGNVTFPAYFGSLRGVGVVRPVGSGEALLRVPHHLCVSRAAALRSMDGVGFLVKHDLIGIQKKLGCPAGDAAPMLLLMQERMKGAASRWKPLLDVQPAVKDYHSVASCWPDMTLLSELFHPYLEELASAELQARATGHSNFVDYLRKVKASNNLPPQLTRLGFEDVSREIFDWAWLAMQTRGMTCTKAAYTDKRHAGEVARKVLAQLGGKLPDFHETLLIPLMVDMANHRSGSAMSKQKEVHTADTTDPAEGLPPLPAGVAELVSLPRAEDDKAEAVEVAAAPKSVLKVGQVLKLWSDGTMYHAEVCQMRVNSRGVSRVQLAYLNDSHSNVEEREWDAEKNVMERLERILRQPGDGVRVVDSSMGGDESDFTTSEEEDSSDDEDDPTGVQVVCTARTARKPGQQMYISYGPKLNMQLLLTYGFIPEDNRDDVVFTELISAPPSLDATARNDFTPAAQWDGPRAGCAFKRGDAGLGYYTDTVPAVHPSFLGQAGADDAGAAAQLRLTMSLLTGSGKMAYGGVLDSKDLVVPTAELKYAGFGLKCDSLQKFRLFVYARRTGTTAHGCKQPISAHNERDAVAELIELIGAKEVQAQARLEGARLRRERHKQREMQAKQGGGDPTVTGTPQEDTMATHMACCFGMAERFWRSVLRVLGRHALFWRAALECVEQFGLPGADKTRLAPIAQWALDVGGLSVDMAADLVRYLQAWPVGPVSA